jgi:predicted ATPase
MDLTARVFTARGYRSLRQITYPLTRLDVFVGANGVGKTNLYRALELLRAAADNSLGATLARDGMASTFWAGPRRARDPAEIELSISLGDAEARARGAGLTAQIWLVTHSERLADAIAATGAGEVRTVEKHDGATWVGGLSRVGGFREDEDE